jgi:hypothetical protein
MCVGWSTGIARQVLITLDDVRSGKNTFAVAESLRIFIALGTAARVLGRNSTSYALPGIAIRKFLSLHRLDDDDLQALVDTGWVGSGWGTGECHICENMSSVWQVSTTLE